ncbi:hypothetical protein Y1Q_0019371 [Alligator mississippiensis]|uniref:Uncharacterized protein n=1 Tax=Alligator mississippiensis TaxID=8496 RepID=A0A151MRD4_ALLMI|nr:hypothetical protein Y1Q_0019371 [Alligator mississippiensis]
MRKWKGVIGGLLDQLRKGGRRSREKGGRRIKKICGTWAFWDTCSKLKLEGLRKRCMWYVNKYGDPYRKVDHFTGAVAWVFKALLLSLAELGLGVAAKPLLPCFSQAVQTQAGTVEVAAVSRFSFPPQCSSNPDNKHREGVLFLTAEGDLDCHCNVVARDSGEKWR